MRKDESHIDSIVCPAETGTLLPMKYLRSLFDFLSLVRSLLLFSFYFSPTFIFALSRLFFRFVIHDLKAALLLYDEFFWENTHPPTVGDRKYNNDVLLLWMYRVSRQRNLRK